MVYITVVGAFGVVVGVGGVVVLGGGFTVVVGAGGVVSENPPKQMHSTNVAYTFIVKGQFTFSRHQWTDRKYVLIFCAEIKPITTI